MIILWVTFQERYQLFVHCFSCGMEETPFVATVTLQYLLIVGYLQIFGYAYTTETHTW